MSVRRETKGQRSATVRRTRDLIRTAILGGFMPKLLPSEPQLIAEYGTSRNVVRDALSMLREEGLIERQQGTGTLVVASRYHHRVDQLSGFNADRGEVSRDLAVLREVGATTAVAAVLGQAVGSKVVLFERFTVAGGEKVSLWTTYLPGEMATWLQEQDLARPLPELLAGYFNDAVDEVLFSVQACAVDATVALELEVDVGSPALRLDRVARLVGGRAVEFSIGWSRGDRLMLNTVRRSQQ